MPLLLLLGCLGPLHTPDGDERVRGALWVEGLYANLPDYSALVVANSPLPCAPDDAEDAPDTDVDEVASARTWWMAELTSAFTREGAAVVWVWFPRGDAVPDVRLGGEDPDDGTGFTWRVDEAALAVRDGVVSTWTPTEWTLEQDLDGRAALVAGEATVRADFALGDWSGQVEAPRCAEPALGAMLQSALSAALSARAP